MEHLFYSFSSGVASRGDVFTSHQPVSRSRKRSCFDWDEEMPFQSVTFKRPRLHGCDLTPTCTSAEPENMDTYLFMEDACVSRDIDESIQQEDCVFHEPTARAHYSQYTAEDRSVIVNSAKVHGLTFASQQFKVPKVTLYTWMRQVSSLTQRQDQSPTQQHEALDRKILEWINRQIQQGSHVSIHCIVTVTKDIMSTQFPDTDFAASRTWVLQFLKRHSWLLNHM